MTHVVTYFMMEKKYYVKLLDLPVDTTGGILSMDSTTIELDSPEV